MNVLLIATVGGSPEPIVAALKHWQPARVIFVVSPESYSLVDQIRGLSATEGFVVAEGAFDLVDIEDAQDFGTSVAILRELDEPVTKWEQRSSEHRVVVELTGGTKAMTSALAIVARRWPCTFSYVGGLDRTKGGVGVVVSGTERVVHAANPWNSLGYQAIEDACLAFDTSSFFIAAEYLKRARTNTEDHQLKRELSAVLHVVEGYHAWDRFKHGDSLDSLTKARTSGNDLTSALGSILGKQVLTSIDRHLEHLRKVVEVGPSRVFLVDLLANARRRAAEGRFEDAVARLYRVTEAAAQMRLRETHAIPNTNSVEYASVPESLAKKWREDGLREPLKLGLVRAYELLSALGDELGDRFNALGLGEKGSPLSARNMSILAHGFDPVGKELFPKLWERVIELVEIDERELPEFPKLSTISPLRANQA